MTSAFCSIEHKFQSINGQQWKNYSTNKITEISTNELGLFFDNNIDSEYSFQNVLSDEIYHVPEDCTKNTKSFIEQATRRKSLAETHRLCTIYLNEYINMDFTIPSERRYIKYYIKNTDEYTYLPHLAEYSFSFTELEKERMSNGKWVQYHGGNMFIDERLDEAGISPNDVYLNYIRACDILYKIENVFDDMAELVLSNNINTDGVRCILFI